MSNINEILNIIYSYFPKDISYSNLKYKLTPEYEKLSRKRKEALNDKIKSNRFTKELEQVFKGFNLTDFTDLKSYNCYEYIVLLHKNQPILDDDLELIRKLNGKRFDLFLFISIIDNYYYFYVKETKMDFKLNEWKFKKLYVYNEGMVGLIKNLREYMKLQNYREISNEIANITVESLETELLERGQVKVFNCLFTELITNF